MEIVKDTNGITPVQFIDGLYVKREDLFKPFAFSNANGSKLRQCILLLEKNKDLIANGVITGTSVVSPQSVILASVAKSMNVPCTIMYGGTNEKSLSEKPYPMIAKKLGSKIIIPSKLGFTNVLQKRAEEYATKNNLFQVKYGFDLIENLDAFIKSVALQVQNIPKVDNLVITVGSAITIIGVLYGIALYKKPIKNIYAFAIAPNRIDKIEKYRNLIYLEHNILLPLERLKYVDYFAQVGYNYNKSVREHIGEVELHPKYEAKTYRWIKQNHFDGTTLFWIVGGDIK